MKYLQKYENFVSDFKIGDIVVSLETKYADSTYWLLTDYKYEVIDSIDTKSGLKHIKVKEVGKPYSTPENYEDDGHILTRYFPSNFFLTVEDWELNKYTDKYNI